MIADRCTRPETSDPLKNLLSTLYQHFCGEAHIQIVSASAQIGLPSVNVSSVSTEMWLWAIQLKQSLVSSPAEPRHLYPACACSQRQLWSFVKLDFMENIFIFPKRRIFVESHFCMFTRFQFVSSLASSLTGVSTRALSFQTIIWLDGECINGRSKRQYET